MLDGTYAQYLMWLETGQPGGGNRVEWYYNGIVPYRNGSPTTWQYGDYPWTTGDPYRRAIEVNFNLSPYSSDKLYP